MSFYEKYLKYKEKYLQLKAQIGGAECCYNLTGKNVYFFSDEESGAPFRFDGAQPNSKGVDSQLNRDFVFEDGLIADFKNDHVALAFLGDLLDNGEYSIRALEKYIELKNRYPTRVILIGGNRDFNKIRMGIELFFEDSSKRGLDKLPWNGTTNITTLIARLNSPAYSNMTFRENKIPDYLQKATLWNTITDIDATGTSVLERDYNNVATPFHSRLDAMFRKTKGVGGYKFIVDELNKLFPGSGLVVANETTAKIVCLFQMVMAFNWDPEELPEYLRRFNGLYINYLEQSHVISVFNINDKVGVLSHSGIPQKTTKPNYTDEKKLTYPFGYNWNNPSMNFKAGTLRDVIRGIEKEKVSLISEVNNKKTNKYEVGAHKGIYASTHNLIDKFIHLTAATTFKDNKYGARSENSPVVWGLPISTNQRTDINLLVGGNVFNSWTNEDSKKYNKMYVDNQGGQNISYNIFGHTPQYFNPTAWRDTHTLHVNLDVSKIEANTTNNNSSNNYSFAFFYINRTDGAESLLGRIKFPVIPDPADGNLASLVLPYPKETLKNNKKVGDPEYIDPALVKAKIYNGCAYIDEGAIRFIKENPIHYYNVVLPPGRIDISLNHNVIDAPIKCINYPPADFTKYLSSV